MAFTEKNYCNSAVSTGTDTLYTVPSGTTSIVKYIYCCNATTAASTVTIWADPNGTSATDHEIILKTYSVPANDFISINTWIVMDSSSTVKATCSASSAIAVRLSGADIT